MKNKLIAILCILALLITSVEPVMAADTIQGQFGMVNPLYADELSEEDIPDVSEVSGVATFSEPEYIEDEAVFVEAIREAMTERMESITIYYKKRGSVTKEEMEVIIDGWFEAALQETDDYNQGDYLRYHYNSFGAGYNGYGYRDETGLYYELNITFAFTYYTSAEQEAELADEVDALFTKLGIDNSKTHYEKLELIYDYMCDNITYDHANLYDDTHKLKYTAYAALVNKTAVCQGYASLFYYMGRKAGLNVRVISGDSGGRHGWNIVELNGKYYYLDSTWDAGRYPYNYYLLGRDDFEYDHTPDPEYTTEEFLSVYPISKNNYCYHVWDADYRVDEEATCTKDGQKSKYCTKCDEMLIGSTVVIEKLGHTWSEWESETAASYSQAGLESRICTSCGTSESKVIPKYKVKSISINPKQISLFKNSTKVLNLNCKPITPTQNEVTWTSSDTSVVKVDKTGRITAVGTGSATINAKVTGVTTSCTVNVYISEAPDNFEASLNTYNRVELTWDKVTNASSYRILYKKSTESAYKTLTTTSAVRYVTPVLDNGVNYQFRVIVCYGTDKLMKASTYSSTSIYTLSKVSAKITNLAGSHIKLSWNDISGESGYQISCASTKTATSIVAKTGMAVISKIFVKGTKPQYYKVRAYKTENGRVVYGPWSEVVALR